MSEPLARPPGPLAAAATLTRLTWRRTLRDRGAWLSVILVLLPIAFIASLSGRWDPQTSWRRVVNVAIVPLFVALPPLNLAALVAEEIKEKTFSYLWSRPFPRWSILAGKAVALLSFTVLLFAVSTIVCWMIATGGADVGQLLGALAAIGLGVLATGGLAAAIGVLLPRQAVPVSAAYLLVIDLPVGAMPLSISNISITHHIRTLMGTGRPDDTILVAVIWLLGFTVLAVLVSLWRVRRIEPAA